MIRKSAITKALKAAQKVTNGFHPDACEILRQSLTTDRGVKVPADLANPWPVVRSGVPVRIDQFFSTPRNTQEGVAITVQGAFNACFDAGEDVRNMDRIRITHINGVSVTGGRVFRIVGPRYASYEVERVMACEEQT